MTRVRVVLLACALLAQACEELESPTSPAREVSIQTQTFSGTLMIGSSRFYSFTVTDGGATTAMLASVSSTTNPAALSTLMELGIGIPAGTGCAVSTAAEVGPSLVSQISTQLLPGIYCVRVADVGHLTMAVNFVVRFSHP